MTSEHDAWVARALDVDPSQYSSQSEGPDAATGAAAAGAAATGVTAGGTDGGAAGTDDASGGGFLDSVKSLGRSIEKGVSKAAQTVETGVSDAANFVEKKVVAAADYVEDKAVAAADFVEKKAVAAENYVEDKVKSGIKAIKKAFEPPPPVKPGEAGPAQTKRADKLLKAMPPEDQAKVQKILDDAPAQEKGYLEKAIASKHTAAEIEAFQKKIAGKDEAWLQKNLHLVGDSDGKGIKQQWHDSCGPTTIQAMKGELDPIYALQTREDNPEFEDVDVHDGTKKNPKMAQEQKDILVGQSGVAANRDSAGKGMPLDGALNDQSASTGLKFKIEAVDPSTVDDRLADIDKSVNSGLPVPMRVSDAGNSGGHFVLVVGEEDDGKQKTYSIHDPWDGKIVKVTAQQIKDGSFNIAGWNKVSHIYKPSAE